MTGITKLYVRIDGDDAELSTLTAINSVLKASGLNAAAQCRVLDYLLDRHEQISDARLHEQACEARSPRIGAPAHVEQVA